MAKKKQTSLDAVGGEESKVTFETPAPDALETEDAPRPDYAAAAASSPAPMVVTKGYIIENLDGKFVGRDGMWTRDHTLAFHFLTEQDAEAYVTLHHREELIVVAGK